MIFFLIILFNFFFVYFFKLISPIINLYDHPNDIRKIHKITIASLGGFLILLNILFYYLIIYYSESFLNIYLLLGSIVFFLIGYFDDKYNIHAFKKLALSFLIIGLLLFFDSNILIKSLRFSFISSTFTFKYYFSIVFTIFCFIVYMNSFNFFDGINLQSGIYSLFIFLIFIYKSYNVGLSIFIVIGLIFFLYLNLKNKCFLGNNGSLLISFVTAYFFIDAYNKGLFFGDEIFLIMLIPGIDLIRLFFLRISLGKSPMSPDNNHFHHYLLSRYSLFKTNLLIGLLVIVPNLVNFYSKSNYSGYIILVTLFIYLLHLFYLKKKSNSNISL